MGEFGDYFGYVVMLALLGAAWIGLPHGGDDD